MHILVVSRKLLKLSGFIPLDCRCSRLINLFHNILIFFLATFAIFSFGYIVITTDNFQLQLNAAGLFAAGSSFLGSYITLIIRKTETVQQLDHLEAVINERSQLSKSIDAIYTKANSFVEQLGAFNVTWFTRLNLGVFSLIVLSSLFIYAFVSNFSNDAFLMVYPLSLVC